MNHEFFWHMYCANLVLMNMSSPRTMREIIDSAREDVFEADVQGFLRSGIRSPAVSTEVLELLAKTEGGASHWQRDSGPISDGAMKAYLMGLTLKCWTWADPFELKKSNFTTLERYVEQKLLPRALRYREDQYTDGTYSDFECVACSEFARLHRLIDKKRQVYLQTLCTEEDAA